MQAYSPRRRPRFGRFIGTGAVLGIVLGIVISFASMNPQGYSDRTAAGFLAAFFGLIGALVAAIVAVLLAGKE